MNFIKAFGQALKVMTSDKWIMLLSMIPVLVGAALYYWLGSWMYGDVLAWGNQWVKEAISNDSFGNIVSWIVGIVMTIVLYFIISWTFVLVISIIASPFNDVISSRVERAILGRSEESVGASFTQMFGRIFRILWNESKKIVFIIALSTFGFLLSFIPFLVPVSMLISATLLAVGFLDYSWSRHDMSFSACVSNLKASFLSYSLGGIVFLFLIAVPILNLFLLPYAVVYFTVLYADGQKVIAA
jgi:CysZ protein